MPQGAGDVILVVAFVQVWKEGGALTVGGGQEQLCTFNVRCPGARHVYLVGDLSPADGGAATTVSMRAVGAGPNETWQAVLLLRPGRYRFRYYVDDGARLTYFSTSNRIDSWDAVLTVQAGRSANQRARPEADPSAAADCETAPATVQLAAWVEVGGRSSPEVARLDMKPSSRFQVPGTACREGSSGVHG